MTEEEAIGWLEQRVSRETMQRLGRLKEIVLSEAARQNLVAASTQPFIWTRHIVDSVQLLRFAPADGRWVDLGSGAGFPGLVVGIVGEHHVTLVESRAKRIVFLKDAVEALDLAPRVQVEGARVEILAADSFDVISARAFAPLPRLLQVARHLSSETTCWVLPKGRNAQAELDAVRGTWQGNFRVEQSLTDPEAAIIVASHVRPRSRTQRGSVQQ